MGRCASHKVAGAMGVFGAGEFGTGGDGTRATLGTVRGGTVSEANGGVERSETVPCPELPRYRP